MIKSILPILLLLSSYITNDENFPSFSLETSPPYPSIIPIDLVQYTSPPVIIPTFQGSLPLGFDDK